MRDKPASGNLGTHRSLTIISPPALSLTALARDVRKLSHYRDLLYTLSTHRIKVRYKQSALGVLWAVVQPLALMLIYTVIFSTVARFPSEGSPYAVFAYAAILPWTVFSTAVTSATNSLVSHASLVTKVYFPREILPLTYVIAALFDFVVASSLFAVLLAYYRVKVTATAVLAIPIMMILFMFVSAIVLALSALHVRFRDVGMAVPLVLQLWMFATPVVYPLSVVPERLRPFYLANPMVGIIDGFRRVTLNGELPDFQLLCLSMSVSLGLLTASYVYFKRVEATLADVI